MISPLSEAEKLLSDLVSFPSTAGQSNAEIINYDCRYEWFFNGNELLSLGYFYKDFLNLDLIQLPFFQLQLFL
mgnify:CR=1 FL=1